MKKILLTFALLFSVLAAPAATPKAQSTAPAVVFLDRNRVLLVNVTEAQAEAILKDAANRGNATAIQFVSTIPAAKAAAITKAQARVTKAQTDLAVAQAAAK